MLELTPAGHEVVSTVTDRRHREFRRILDRLDPHERAHCVATLQKLHQLMATDTDHPRDQLPW